MLKLRALMLLGLCLVIPARAGLLEDDEARQQIQKLQAQVLKLEDAIKQQQQSKSMLDLQSQIDALNGEIRKLRGQNEELTHGLQDAEKRQKDFYVDLDTRVRHFESVEEAAKEAAAAAAANPPPAATVPAAAAVSSDPSDPISEDRAIEAAYSLFKGGSHADAIKAFQEFLKKYPDSVHVPNADYWMGNAQFALKNYKAALSTYQGLLKGFPGTSRAPDVLLGIANCQRGLKQAVSAKKTLKQLIAQYPDSDAAAKAKKLLAAKK